MTIYSDLIDLRHAYTVIQNREAEIERLTAENERLRKELEDERMLKQGWIDEYVKLRDMGEMPEDSP